MSSRIRVFVFSRCPGVELLDHMITTFSYLKETPYCFPQYEIYIPINQPTTSLLTFVTCVLFDGSHSDKCEVRSPYGFGLYFPDG